MALIVLLKDHFGSFFAYFEKQVCVFDSLIALRKRKGWQGSIKYLWCILKCVVKVNNCIQDKLKQIQSKCRVKKEMYHLLQMSTSRKRKQLKKTMSQHPDRKRQNPKPKMRQDYFFLMCNAMRMTLNFSQNNSSRQESAKSALSRQPSAKSTRSTKSGKSVTWSNAASDQDLIGQQDEPKKKNLCARIVAGMSFFWEYFSEA